MEVIRIARDLAAIAVLTLSLAVMLVAIRSPESYGVWLQKIDQGRWGHYECYEYEYEGTSL
jgi:hypothetical protein